jgi:hypothetical protein
MSSESADTSGRIFALHSSTCTLRVVTRDYRVEADIKASAMGSAFGGPPFYFVSLPIATVIAASEIVTWISVGLYLAYGPYLIGASGWEDVTILWSFFQGQPLLTFLVGGSFARMFVSICLLWRTLRQEDGQGSVSKIAQQRVRALLLLLAFMWPWRSIGYLVYLTTRP